MKVEFCSENEEMILAWKDMFSNTADVEVYHESIFAHPATAIASPGNSFGHMDAGLDAEMVQYFGNDLEQKVQDTIKTHYDGELLIGQALYVETKNQKFPYFISAPTMQVPMKIKNTINVYHAIRAIIILAKRENFNHIRIPGMGISTGEMDSQIAARQAYEALIAEKEMPKNWEEARKYRNYLLGK